MLKALFFVACIVLGIAAGWWWSSSPDTRKTVSLNTVSRNLSDLFSGQGTDTSNDVTHADTSSASVQHNSINTPASTRASDQRIDSYYEGIMKVAPSVVSLYARSSAYNNSSKQTNSQGSGVIVDANGIILTNLHLVAALEQITVVLNDGRRYPAKLIGSDQETDLAVVRIEAQNLPFLRLDEAQPLRVGDIVLAIGNPFGVGQTVTQGIVSATRRRVTGGSVWQNFIQIDAAINPGNSGGALINSLGQLVGVNTAVFRGDASAEGIGFSIPAELLSQVVPQIIEYGTVARGWLGIGVDDITMYTVLREMKISGAVITEILPDSPASQGGLQKMDIVVRVGEQNISSATQLLLKVSALPPGATAKLTVMRSAQSELLSEQQQPVAFKTVDLKMRLGTRPNTNEPDDID